MSGTPELPGQFVVRRHAPARSLAMLGAAVPLAALALYAAFEAGRWHAGFDKVAQIAASSRYEQRLQALQQENRGLHAQVAAFDTFRAADAREHAEFRQEMADLKAQLEKDQQDLAMYRGVVTPGRAGRWADVEQLRITAGVAARQFHLHLVLVQSGRPQSTLNGSLDLSIAGTAGGQGQSLPLSALTAGGEQSVDFSLRYFQAVDRDLQLPAGFVPAQLHVQMRSARAADAPLELSFPWSVEAP
jgi:hypothetical protein